MIPPVNAPITQSFGESTDFYAQFGLQGHHGIDFGVPVGTVICAPEDARVYRSDDGVYDQYTGNFCAGETVVLKGQNEHWLLHLSKRIILVGQHVEQGQVIGYSGNTGVSSGPHCHWGVRPLNPNINNGFRGFVDPLSLLEEDNMSQQQVDSLQNQINALNARCDELFQALDTANKGRDELAALVQTLIARLDKIDKPGGVDDQAFAQIDDANKRLDKVKADL